MKARRVVVRSRRGITPPPWAAAVSLSSGPIARTHTLMTAEYACALGRSPAAYASSTSASA
eukprot:1594026-Prymnesium_polylepis.1